MNRSGIFLASIAALGACLALLIAPGGALAQPGTPSPAAPAILAPLPGQALQGVVQVRVSAGGENFQSAEIAFAYAGDDRQTWFLIHERSQPPDAQTAFEWDTSLITDGDYTLRLRVLYTDGSIQTVETQGLRVRNYTPVETDTPAPLSTTPPEPSTPLPETPASGTTPTSGTAAPAAAAPETAAAPIPPAATPTTAPTSLPAPARLPSNPAALAPGEVLWSAARGVLAALGAFALAGIYWSLRRLGRR